MHYTLRILSLYGLFILFSLFSLRAQTAKVGYVDMQKLYGQLPAAAQVEKEYSDYSKLVYGELEQKKKVLDDKARRLSKPKTMEESANPNPDDLKQQAALGAETEAFHRELNQKQKQVADKRESLYTALRTRIQQAIKEVAAEKGYSSVMDANTMLHYPAAEDITSLVLSKLAVK